MVKSSGVQSAHLEVFAAEFIGTAALVLVGLSLVIHVWLWQPDRARCAERGLVTGICFGTTRTLIALSPVGKVGGAHINAVVTLGFRLVDAQAGPG